MKSPILTAVRHSFLVAGFLVQVCAPNMPCAAPMADQRPIEVGIVGLDAHAVPWTKIIHDPAVPPPISHLRIVAAVATPSPDIPFSNAGKFEGYEPLLAQIAKFFETARPR